MPEKIGQLMYDDINDQPNSLEIVLTDFSHQVSNIDHPSLRRWLSNPILFTGLVNFNCKGKFNPVICKFDSFVE